MELTNANKSHFVLVLLQHHKFTVPAHFKKCCCRSGKRKTVTDVFALQAAFGSLQMLSVAENTFHSSFCPNPASCADSYVHSNPDRDVSVVRVTMLVGLSETTTSDVFQELVCAISHFALSLRKCEFVERYSISNGARLFENKVISERFVRSLVSHVVCVNEASQKSD